ncbi:MAG: class II aldolase/adducin family protein [Anaerolineae bacterium]|nr:class II aldolase/adducin family protein [Anaerolineae bacterium]
MSTPSPDLVNQINDPAVRAMREKIARFGHALYQRQLTDAAGGNLSSRVGDFVVMSPRYAGSKRQWQLSIDDTLVCDIQGNILAGNGEISREAKVHFKLYREYGDYGTGVIHAHARNLLVFAALARPMPPVLEATRKFGVVPVVPFAPAHSAELAESVANAIGAQKEKIKKQAACVIAPYHGLFTMGKDIDAAFDAVERMDVNAYIILMGGLLERSDGLSAARDEMERAVKAHESKS